MREALRRAFETVEGGGGLGFALRRTEEAAWAVVNDPCPYGAENTPELEDKAGDLDAAGREMLDLAAEALAVEGRDNDDVQDVYGAIECGMPGFGPRDTADWLKPIFAEARRFLGWSIPNYWPDHHG